MKQQLTINDILDVLGEMMEDKRLDAGQKELVREAYDRLDQITSEAVWEIDLTEDDLVDDDEFGVPV